MTQNEPLGTRVRVDDNPHDRAIKEIERLRSGDEGFILIFPSPNETKVTIITDLESASLVSILDHLHKVVRDVHIRSQN